jgi:hypothetical protein
MSPRGLPVQRQTGRTNVRNHRFLLVSLLEETFAECSILFKFKEGENFNHRNILDISRIKI